MDTQRDKSKIITYPPETLRTFTVEAYQWIDNLNFTIHPEECLKNAEEYIRIAKEMFLDAGWDGDGAIELMWIPPFMLRSSPTAELTLGVTIWHVKQLEDGVSWLLSPNKIAQFTLVRNHVSVDE
ncbi:hypothetical protein [Chitinophaga pinensis]|uniref:Uncharacterized protein n=1 Tax=Chitinophaga pinensis (strain ATCC 43595 / DSM 2588 / LMG 13176 / NBRC 15968 / NCIMB 11800 / UQM 2034) TaxID=485918 RepID=A0A979G1E2_CHIPD|nr:hypothetical protein [Chitinophaga pinensis]ACU59037.1 hypothetical protein Cpin_1540 [Chitinophaga pinensis DSM 2588]